MLKIGSKSIFILFNDIITQIEMFVNKLWKNVHFVLVYGEIARKLKLKFKLRILAAVFKRCQADVFFELLSKICRVRKCAYSCDLGSGVICIIAIIRSIVFLLFSVKKRALLTTLVA